MKSVKVLFLVLLAVGCGREKSSVDSTGFVVGESDLEAFSRGCQCYFRGSLSRAREEFNGVIYRFPDSPLLDDARLAVRRIEADVAASETEVRQDNTFLVATSAVLVGRQGAVPVMNRISAAMVERGLTVEIHTDDEAPEITLVLYPEGGLQQAGEIADSLSVWLIRPEIVPLQPGGELTQSVVPGYQGIVVVIGTDATVSSGAPGS